MVRPTKSQDYFVHRLADLILVADAMRESGELQNAVAKGGISLQMPDGMCVDVDNVDEIAIWIGRTLFGDLDGQQLKPEHRPQILRQIADALERKSGRKRKSGKADELVKMRMAWLTAKAEQSGLYRGDDPTFPKGCSCLPISKPDGLWIGEHSKVPASMFVLKEKVKKSDDKIKFL